MMDELDCCRGCGAKRPADAPSGLCPACLLKAGLLGEGSELPDETITFGPASSSVLASFGEVDIALTELPSSPYGRSLLC